MGIGESFDKMSAREQKLLVLLGVVAAAIVFIGLPAYLYSDVASTRSQNEAVRTLLRRMDSGAELLAKRTQERAALEQRYAKPAPALASFIESAAKANGVEVPESKDQPDIPGKGYTERVTVVKMRKVGLAQLVKTLEKLERSGHPVAISRLTIKTRSGGPDIYDVELGVSAFDKAKADKAGDAKGGQGSKGESRDESKGKKL